MYEPHEAREDTLLFPAFREIGFHKIVEEVAGFEKKAGIYDLSQFTPRA